jgi:hypothetical protein
MLKRQFYRHLTYLTCKCRWVKAAWAIALGAFSSESLAAESLAAERRWVETSWWSWWSITLWAFPKTLWCATVGMFGLIIIRALSSDEGAMES